MQVVKNQAYSNFIDSINSDQTRQVYEYTLSQFLKHYEIDLDSFLKLSQQDISNYIINYLVNKKISRQYKTVIFSSIKHACEMNDVILNWKKLKKFIKSEKTYNSINGKDRGYFHEEIQKILEYSDQRLKTAFLILASTGVRIGALQLIKISDLEQIDNLYKITVYRGDTEEYITFCSPECAKEIDSYLEYRKRRGETITQDSYLLVKKFTPITKVKGEPFKGKALGGILQDCIDITGIREIDRVNRYKRKAFLLFLAVSGNYMLCEKCESAKKISSNALEPSARQLHEKCAISITLGGKKQKCECECNFTIPLLEQLKASQLADFHPKSWLSEYRSTWVEHLLIMGLFYYFMGLILSYLVGELNYSLFGYEERYSPRSLLFILEASPLEETLFFGIPFYATGNQIVLLSTGIVWTFMHLMNTETATSSLTSLAYENFAFTTMPLFFAIRTWKSGKGWFSILFHAIWDLSIFCFLILGGRSQYYFAVSYV